MTESERRGLVVGGTSIPSDDGSVPNLPMGLNEGVAKWLGNDFALLSSRLTIESSPDARWTAMSPRSRCSSAGTRR